MAVHCPRCGREYDVVLFEGDEKIKCKCGESIGVSGMETVEDFLRFFESEEERKNAREIQSDAQEICRMILDEERDPVDIEIAKARLKEKVTQLFPSKLNTYEMIYESRFRRLWEQFRQSGPGSF